MNEENLAKLEAKLTEWFNVKAEADALVLKEKTLRREIFDLGFPAPEFGTNKLRISHGMALIAKLPASYTVDKAVLDALMSIENAVPLLQEVINYRPEVRDAKFRALAKDDLNLIAPAITQKQGSPQLEIKPQKSVRW